MNKYQEIAEKFTGNGPSIWETSFKYGLLSKSLENALFLIDEFEREGTEEEKARIPGLKIEVEQISEALKGPTWLRKIREENDKRNKRIMEGN